MVIFAFLSRKSIGSNFRACLHAHKYSQKFDMLACIHTKWASLFSRVVIFAGGNFRIFSRRENYNSAKINVLKVDKFIVRLFENFYHQNSITHCIWVLKICVRTELILSEYTNTNTYKVGCRVRRGVCALQSNFLDGQFDG